MFSQTLIETTLLKDHLNDPDWVLVDCRFDLNNPEWGWNDYQKMHIPGAIYAHLNKDLSGVRTPVTGRHPLPETQIFARKLAEWGITKTKQIVVYDTVGGSFAARLWWLLRFYGYLHVAVLNGGLGKWIREGNSLQGGIENGNPLDQVPELEPNRNLMVTTQEMVQIFSDPSFRVIDARSHERYLGENETMDPIAGRIPGALNRFHENNLQADLTMKPAETLQKEFAEILGDTSPKNVIVYCGSGVTSCHHLLAMKVAGMEGARLYLGSWSEWIQDPAHPIAKG